MIPDVGNFHRKIRGEGVLQVQGPVPDVRGGEIAIDTHDGAGTGKAIERTRADIGAIDRYPTVPLRHDGRD